MPGAYQLLGITLDELHGWRIAFDAYGRDGLRATNRNIIANEPRRIKWAIPAATAMPKAGSSAARSSLRTKWGGGR